MLTAQVMADANVRPQYINTFTVNDPDQGEIEGYGLKLTAMKNGDSVTLEVNSDPEGWPEKEGQYGPSVKAFFTTEDGTIVSAFIRTGETALRSGEGPGVSLIQTLRKYAKGDIVTITKETKPVPNSDRSYNLFHVEQVASFQ